MSVYLATSASGHELPAIDVGGVRRFLGAIPTPNYAAPRYSDVFPLVPRSRWRPSKRPGKGVPVLDQGQHGSCVGHGFATAAMRTWANKFPTAPMLSACWIYGNINGNRDAGSDPGDAARLVSEVGVCLESEVPEGMIYSRQFPASAKQTAARFRFPPLLACHDWDEIVSAYLGGCELAITVNVAGPDWQRLPPNGIPEPVPGAGNHCTHGGDELAWIDGQWALGDINSWGPEWGLDGRYYTVEGHFARQPFLSCWAFTDALPDPQAADNPPAAR